MSSILTRWGTFEFFIGPIWGISLMLAIVSLIADRESGVYRISVGTLFASGAIALSLVIALYLAMWVVLNRIDRDYRAAKDELTRLAESNRSPAATRLD